MLFLEHGILTIFNVWGVMLVLIGLDFGLCISCIFYFLHLLLGSCGALIDTIVSGILIWDGIFAFGGS
jgi:hypothetical protein